MPVNSESINRKLFDLLSTRGFDPKPLDVEGKVTPVPEEAAVIKFDFIKDGENYGKVWISIDGSKTLQVYYGDSVSNSPDDATQGIGYDDTWTGLLKHLKNWAQRRQLGFDLRNENHLVSDMARRKHSQRVSEGVLVSDIKPKLTGLSVMDLDKLAESAGNDYYLFNKNVSKNLNLPKYKGVSSNTLNLYSVYYKQKLKESSTKKLSNDERELFNTFNKRVKTTIESVNVGDSVSLLSLSTLAIPDDKVFARLQGFLSPKKVKSVSRSNNIEYLHFVDGSKFPDTDNDDPIYLAQSWVMTKLFDSYDSALNAYTIYALIGDELSDNIQFNVDVDTKKEKLDENETLRKEKTQLMSVNFYNTPRPQKKDNNMKQVNEGYYAMGKQASYSDAVPTTKIILQHTRKIQEGEQRYRNIAKIFVENMNGERFLLPTTKPGIARVYARHISEGGTPYDERGKHINSLVEEYQKMAGFVRATKNKQFNESAQELITEGVKHYQSLRETLHKMCGRRGYTAYFESWQPTLIEDGEEQTNLNELFVQETLDPRIESVMPILSRLHKKTPEVSETLELAEWADEILENSLELPKNVSESVSRTNKKIKNIIENRFPALPSQEIFFDRSSHLNEWSTFKQQVIEYQLKYDDGSQNAKLKMRALPKFISESYHMESDQGLDEIKELIQAAFKNAVPAKDLVPGKKYDVAVVFLDKLSKILEVNLHHNHTIKDVKFSDAINDYIVSTKEGLEGASTMDQVEDVETLFFEKTGGLDNIETYLRMKIEPKLNDWELSIVSDEPKKKIDESHDIPLAVRSLYTQTYAKFAKTAGAAKGAKQMAYAQVAKKYGKEMADKLKAYHDQNSKLDEEGMAEGFVNDFRRGIDKIDRASEKVSRKKLDHSISTDPEEKRKLARDVNRYNKVLNKPKNRLFRPDDLMGAGDIKEGYSELEEGLGDWIEKKMDDFLGNKPGVDQDMIIKTQRAISKALPALSDEEADEIANKIVAQFMKKAEAQRLVKDAAEARQTSVEKITSYLTFFARMFVKKWGEIPQHKKDGLWRSLMKSAFDLLLFILKALAEGLAKKESVAEGSDISGLLAASHLNKSFIITAELAEGGKKKFRVKAQSERVAKEKFMKHHSMAKIVDVKEEGVSEEKEKISPLGKDRMGTTCTKCKKGKYKETSIHDDQDGVLHCSNTKCNHEVKRWPGKDPDVTEDLDADQKRAGQLGPTEKVGPKGAVGKLVGN